MSNNPIFIDRDILRSDAFRSLNGSAKNVYFDFLMKRTLHKLKGTNGRKSEWVIKNNGKIEYCYSEAEKKGIGRASFMRALDNLVRNGMIDIKHSGSGGKKGDKSLYAISERWRKYGTPEFELKTRPKDTRGGRGFKSGSKHWRKTNMGIKSDNPTVIKSDNRKAK